MNIFAVAAFVATTVFTPAAITDASVSVHDTPAIIVELGSVASGSAATGGTTHP